MNYKYRLHPNYIMLYILIAITLSIYLLTIGFRTNLAFGVRLTKWLRIMQLILLLVLITIFILSKYNTYLSGYWTPKIIFWTWFFIVMLLHGLGNKPTMPKHERIFYKIIYFLPVVWLPLMVIPFIPIALGLALYPHVVGESSMILYSSKKVRLEQPYIRFLGPDPPIDVFVRGNLFSYKIATLSVQFNNKLDSLVILETSAESIHVTHYKRDGDGKDFAKAEFTVPLKIKSRTSSGNLVIEPDFNHDTTYTISTQQLKSNIIPDSVFSMINLRHLSITGMDCDYGDRSNCWGIEQIPGEIRNLKDLKTLRLTVNGIHTIPRELTFLPNLILIDLSDNAGLDRIEAITQIKNLQYLYLFGCGLTKLPNDIGKLTQLKELGLPGNHIDKTEQQRIQKALPRCKILF